MAQRNESVRLSLVDDFTPGVLRAAAAAQLLDNRLGDLDGSSVDLGDSSRSASEDVDALGKSTERTTRQVKDYTLAQAIAEEQAKRNRASLRGQAAEILDSLGAYQGSTDAINENTDAVERNNDAYDRSRRDLDTYTGRLGLLVQTAGALGPALAPLGAVAVGGAAALASQLGFAAAAAGTAIVAFQGVGDALTAVDKAALQPTAANLEAARLAMEKLSPAARGMVRELHGLEPVLSGLRDAAAEEMFPGLIDGMDRLVTLAPKVESIMRKIGGAIGDLFEEGAADLTSERWANFFDMIESEARPTIEALGHSIGSIAHGLGQLWVAFSPLNRTFNGWLEDAAKGFDDWATGLSQTDGFREFVDYIKTNGPIVGKAVAAIANALLQIVEAAAPLGGPVLQGITALANAIADIADSPLGAPIMAMVTAVSALSLASKAAAGSMRLLGMETAAAGSAMGGLTGVAVVVGLQQVGSNLDKLKSSMSELRADMESGSAPSSQTLEDFFSGIASQMPVIGPLFDGATDAVHRLGDMMGIQTRTTQHFVGGLIGAATASRDLAEAQGHVQHNAEKLHLVIQQQRADAREQAAAIRDAAQGFYTLADAVKKPELTLGDLETRMRRQAAVTRQMAEDMQTAIEKGVNPRALQQMWDELGTGASGAMHELATGSKEVRDQFNSNFKASQGAVHSLEGVLDHLADAIDRLAGKKPKPKLDLDDAAFNRKIESGNHAVDNLGRQHAEPKVHLDGAEETDHWIGNLRSGLTGVGKQHPTPKVTLLGADEAAGKVSFLKGLLNSLHDKTVHITTISNQIGGVTSTAGGHSAPGEADGGSVPKDGGPYADRYLYRLAPGEEIISNRYGQADRFRADRAAGRIPGYANGGTVGSGGDPNSNGWAPNWQYISPWALMAQAAEEAGDAVKHLALQFHVQELSWRDIRKIELQDRKHHLSELLKLEEKERDAIKERLDALKQERESIISGVAGIISAGHELLGGVRTPVIPGIGSTDPITWTDGPATFQSFQDALDAQFGTASQLKHVLKLFKQKHLGSALLQYLITNGADIATLEDFASQSASDLQALSSQFNQINQFTHSVGNQAAGVAGLNQAISKQSDLLHQANEQRRETNKRLERVEKRLDHLDQTGPERTGRAVADAEKQRRDRNTRTASRRATR